MLIVLPPSETKSDGGRGAPLDLATLSFPSLTAVRERIATALVELAADPARSATVLGLGQRQLAEVDRNAALWTSPTRPAIERYTGVLYDALGVGDLTRASRTKADERLAVGSALFGVVRARDQIPAYRLSSGSKLPGMGTLAAQWKPDLTDALTGLDDEVVVDLRSGGYRALGPIAGAMDVTVLTEAADGSRSVVSHFNKHHKGVMARSLVTTRKRVRDIDSLAAVVSDGGQRTEIASATELIILTD
ncbi:peroxide stress protein YaaA [Williamsia phyllosphaerae]|uniref:Peroxide stress protein YaaA n=1 Tax=Williamsia phyllosphaerae TaxID=885042 RepID=A0ABQ1V7U8_9NOCA|nr:peroxide stress protein YaaA [Williamsia phyllosphaerae]GGF40047.1 peroxide stress protein YaaA [Williamsia phyllosphaerae]